MAAACVSAARTATASTECGDIARVRALATELTELGPRPDSSPAASVARELIERRLGELGLAPERQPIGRVAVPEIAVGSATIRRAAVRTSTDENVWIRIGPAGRARLFLGHYDTVRGAPGAVDNAAAVAILLELARCMVERPPGQPVIVAFTGAEEIGLLGARRLVRRLGDGVELAVSLDLIGHQRPLVLNGLSALWSRERLGWLASRVRAAGADATAAIPHRIVSREMPQLERSDHGPFTSAGIPALHLYGRGAERIYLAYHTPLDDVSQLDDAAIENAFALTRELAYAEPRLPGAVTDPGMWLDIPLGPRVLPATLAFAAEAVAAVAALALLVLGWRRRRSQRSCSGLLVCVGAYVAGWAAATAVGRIELAIHGNRLAFAHDIGRYEIASTAIAIAVFGSLVAWRSGHRPVARGGRYALTAAGLVLVVGLATLLAGAFEIAWAPLAAAVGFAAAARLVERRVACAIATAVGIALLLPPLAPAFIRESVFHGFYPRAVPLALYLAAVALPIWLAAFGAIIAQLDRDSPPARAPLAIALAVVAIAATAALIIPSPSCTPEASARAGLACEIGVAPDAELRLPSYAP